MNSGLRKIFWGIFFISFHIYLGSIPIIPSFVGWIIILQGLTQLENFLSKKSLILKFVGIAIIFLALISDFAAILQYNLKFFSSILLMLLLILEFVFFYNLFEILFEGYKKEIIYQRIYIILSTILFIIISLSQVVPSDQNIMFFVWAGVIALRIFLLVYISGKNKVLFSKST